MKKRARNKSVDQLYLATRLLGLLPPKEQIRQAKALVVTLLEEGFNLSDIGRALGYKDYRNGLIFQNVFPVHARLCGLLNGVHPKVGGQGFHTAAIRKKRVLMCRKALQALLYTGMSRDEAVARANHAFYTGEIGEALGLSRPRIEQLQQRAVKKFKHLGFKRRNQPRVFKMLAGFTPWIPPGNKKRGRKK
jgi:hypothetical protein